MNAHSTLLWQNVHGPVLHLTFQGIYPSGPEGSVAATRIRDAVVEALEPVLVAAVLFDLTELKYQGGEALLPSLIFPLLRQGEWKTLPPFCFVATGETAAAFAPLLDAAGWRRLFDPPLLDNLPEGIEFLRELSPPLPEQ